MSDPAPAECTVTRPYLAPSGAGGLCPGVSLALPRFTALHLPLAGVCVYSAPEVGGGFVSVYRLRLEADVNAHGLILRAGKVLYLRLHSQTEPLAAPGALIGKGEAVTIAQPRGEAVRLAVRIGGEAGIPAWDRGEPGAIGESPETPGRAYPADPKLLRRAVALRYLDPGYLGFGPPLNVPNFL